MVSTSWRETISKIIADMDREMKIDYCKAVEPLLEKPVGPGEYRSLHPITFKLKSEENTGDS